MSRLNSLPVSTYAACSVLVVWLAFWLVSCPILISPRYLPRESGGRASSRTRLWLGLGQGLGLGIGLRLAVCSPDEILCEFLGRLFRACRAVALSVGRPR